MTSTCEKYVSLVLIQDTIYLFVVVNEAKGQPSCEHYIIKFKLTSYIVFKYRFLI